MKQALFLARLRSGQPGALTPAEALELATNGGARCLGRPDLGRLEVGAPADIAVWPADDLADIADAVAGLVLGPSRQVRHLFVGGEPIVTDGSLVGLDIRAAHRELGRRARLLWA
jgi:cytosine/adenosine deaminase-related metal-dependent hydrolase